MSPRRKARITYHTVVEGEVVSVTRARGTCAGCRRDGILLDDEGRCRPCRENAAHRCAACGEDAILVRGEERCCHRCVLHRELDELIAPSIASEPGIARLREALLSAANPQLVRRWLARTSGGRLLAEMLESGGVLSHEDLDAFGADRSVAHLRGVLVAAGVLAADERSLARFEERARGRLDEAGLHPADLRIARSWLRWSVLARLHRREQAGLPMMHSSANALVDLRQVARFLSDLQVRQKSLAALAQDDLDAWFAQGGASPFKVRAFLAWAQRHDHLPTGLSLPPVARKASPEVAEEEARLAVARRVVSDEALSADVRVAAALVVLYGQPVSRVARLKRSDIHRSGDGATVLELDGHPLPIHEPFATLLDELPVRRQNGVRDQFDSVWLFPRADPARHVGLNTLSERLRRIGIEPRRMRNAARAQLAREIPASLLSEILGITPVAAVAWASRVGSNWTSYAAIRAPGSSRP